MIFRDDLRDFNIDYDRMSCIYIKNYPELEEEILSIKSFSGLLLNDYTFDILAVDALVIDIDIYCYVLRSVMYEDDYLSFMLDYFEMLKGSLTPLELQEKFEQCMNIVNFVDRYNARIYLTDKKNKGLL